MTWPTLVQLIHFKWCFRFCCLALDPWPWHLVQSREGLLCCSPKIDLSHFTSRCCCALPWPTLTQTTAPLLASVCSGENPAPHSPQPSARAHPKPLSLFLRKLCLCPTSQLVSFSLPLPVRLLIFLSFLLVFMLCSVFRSSLSASNPYLSFVAFTPLLFTLPWDQFTCAWPNIFLTQDFSVCYRYGIPLWSLLSLLSCHSPALHL